MDKGVDQKRVTSGDCLFRRLIPRQAVKDASLNADKASWSSKGGILETSQEEMVLTRAIDEDASVSPEEYVRDTSALLSLQPWIFKKEREKNGEMGDDSGCAANGSANALQPKLSPRSIGLGYKHCRNRSSLKSRLSQRYHLKPLTSIERLTPQLYQENLEVKEYIFTSMSSSPASSKRPFFVTDGDRVISKSGYDSSSIQPGNGLLKNADGVCYETLSEDGLRKDNNGDISLGMGRTVVGVPPILKSRRQKRKSLEMRLEKLGTAHSQKSQRLSQSQGSFDGVLPFCLGISIGIALAIVSNKTEIEKLNSLLEHTKDLVQDLQEELDMKDSLTVKELSNEGCQSQEVNCFSEIEESVGSFQNQYPAFHLAPQERDGHDCPHFPVAAGNSESLSKIEAELEAELEILEQNMKACSLERRKSDLSEAEVDGSNEYNDFQPGSLNTTYQLVKDLKNIDIVLHIGDLCYANGYLSQWDQFTAQIEPIASAVPYMIGSGNHERDWPGTGSFYGNMDSGGECGVLAETMFYVPAENRAKFWYSTDYGMFRFCIADTEHDWRPGTEQYKFIEHCLSSVDREKQPWLIFLAHRVLGYSSADFYGAEGSTEEPMGRESLQGLWQKYKVDIAFYGHVHNYERTCPVYQNTCVRNGSHHYSGPFGATTHVVVGGGGASLADFTPVRAKWSYVQDHDYGFVKLTAFNHSTLLFE